LPNRLPIFLDMIRIPSMQPSIKRGLGLS